MCLLFACAITSSVSAQTLPAQASDADAGRPARAKPIQEPPQTMELNLALFAGNDDATITQTDARLASGLHTDADASMTYQRRAGRATFGVNARSVLRHDQGGTAVTPVREQGGLDLSVAGSRNRLHVSQNVSYSPYYQFGAVPDATISPLVETAQSHGDFANSNLASFGSSTAADWNRSIGRHVALSASYNMQRTRFDQATLNQTFQRAGMGLTRRLTRYLSLRLGYTYQVAEYALAQAGFNHNHDLHLGLDYKGERTTISVTSGSSVTPQNQGAALNLTGNAELTRRIGRTWSAGIAFNRTVQPLEGFTQPVISNGLSSTVTGAMGRRASVSSSAGFTSGTVGLGSAAGKAYSDWTGVAGLHVTLSRRSALETQYFWYGHRFPSEVLLAPGMASGLSRNGLRVGITLQAPLIGHLKGKS